MIVISSEGTVVSYFCSAHSILDKLPLHRGAWQQGKADTAPSDLCVHILGHQYWCNSL